jgi:hypothetical protein
MQKKLKAEIKEEGGLAFGFALSCDERIESEEDRLKKRTKM